LFAPLVLAQAAEIEALPLEAFLADPTKLAKGLTALHQALGTDAVTVYGCTDAAGDEALNAAVEAAARLATTAPGDPVLVAALTGPATLAERRAPGGLAEAAEAGPLLEDVGAALLADLKRFLEAGVNLVVVVEDAVPPAAAVDAWRSAVTPLVNVTRFHQAAPVMLVREATADGLGAVPPSIGLCGPEGAAIGGPPNRLRGVTLPAEPKEWTAPAPGTPLVTTAGVVPASFGFAEVHEACRRVADGLGGQGAG
jgi:acetophenone carboxylase